MMEFYRYQEIVLPDGYTGQVLLWAGDYVTVWLVSANQLPTEKRWRVYKKSELK